MHPSARKVEDCERCAPLDSARRTIVRRRSRAVKMVRKRAVLERSSASRRDIRVHCSGGDV
jgi:hypothetical protein